jgi:hypothetical protein
VDEVAGMLAEGGRVVDEEELGEELEAMEREERERESEEARRKVEGLPEVPRDVTPTTETGIGKLSIEEREPVRAS